MGYLRLKGLADWLGDLNSPLLETRLQADAALLELGASAENALTALLCDLTAPEEARWRAAFLLGALGSRSALPVLVACLTDACWSVRHACACALGELGDPAALPALWTVVTAPEPDEQVNYVAAISLLRISRAHGEAMLRAAAAGGSQAGRNTAVSALATLEF